MSGLRRAVCRALGAGAVGLVPLLAPPSAGANPAATSSALARCAAIASPDARLACYDALGGHALRTTTTAPAAAPASTTPAVTANADRPATSVAADVQAFGLTPAQTHTPPPGPDSLQARVVKVHVDKSSHVSVELDNGQLWAITGAATSLDAGDAVKIERAALGSYLMTTPSKHAYRATRIR